MAAWPMSDSTNQGDEEGTAEPIPEYDQPTIDSTVEKAQSELPRKLGCYLLESRFGQGGMGTVYLATDTVLK